MRRRVAAGEAYRAVKKHALQSENNRDIGGSVIFGFLALN